MNIKEAIETRRSIKHYDSEHRMPEADLKELLRLAKLTPSSFNMQNYRFLVVQDKQLRQQIRAVSWDQAQVTDASVLVLLCADLDAHKADPAVYWGHAQQAVQDMLGPMIRPFYDGKEQLIRDEAIRSSSLAGMTLMLAAKGLGYDSCPMVGFDAEKVAELVHLPANMIISFMLPIGKLAQPAWERGPRLSDEQVVFYDRFK